MKFLELRLNHFGKFNNQDISLKDGINLIYGGNEAGKSTVHTFIRGMLFGIEKTRGRASKDDIYGKYQPWDTPGAYSGSMDIQVEDRTIRIYRSFDKNNKEITILDLDTGRELNGYSDNMAALLEGLTEAGYRSTISIEQLKAKTGQELADEVRNYVTNLSLTKSNEIDVAKALSFLNSKKKELEASLPTDLIQKLKDDILEGLEKETKMDELTEKLNELIALENTKSQINNSLGNFNYPNCFTSTREYESYLNKFPVYEEKFSSYENYLRQLELSEERIRLLHEEITKGKQVDSKTFAAKLDELELCRHRISKLEAEKTNLLLKNKEKSDEKGKKYLSIGLLITGLILLLLSINGNMLLGIAGGIFIVGAIYLYFTANRNKDKLNRDIHQALSEVDGKMKAIKTSRNEILLTFNVSNESELKKKYEDMVKLELQVSNKKSQLYEQEEVKQQLNKQLQGIKNEILIYLNPFEVFSKISTLSREVMNKVREYMDGEINKISEVRDVALRQQEEFTIKKEKIKWQLKNLEGYEDDLLHNQEMLETLEEKNIHIRKELEAILLAVNTINELSLGIHDTFGRELNKIVSSLTKETTDGKYGDIKVDEKMDIKVLSGHQYVAIDKLSVGTMDQLYFAIRVAVSDLIYGENVMPLLFDDSFALYDDKRTQSVLNYLTKRKGQVLIFTCHNREKELLEKNHLSYNYIDLGNNKNNKVF